MTQNLLGAGVFLIQTFAGLYLILLLLRFLMQLARVDYYNPICQAIVKVTDPAVKPLKKILPTIRGVDVSTLFVTLLVQLLDSCRSRQLLHHVNQIIRREHGQFLHLHQ